MCMRACTVWLCVCVWVSVCVCGWVTEWGLKHATVVLCVVTEWGLKHATVVLCVCQCVMLLTIGNINPSVTVSRDHERDLSSTQARYNIHSVFQSLSKVCINVRLRVSAFAVTCHWLCFVTPQSAIWTVGGKRDNQAKLKRPNPMLTSCATHVSQGPLCLTPG